MCELLGPDTSEDVEAAALVALHACGHHRSKFPEVLTGLGVNLNHGPLMTLFRRVIAKLTANGESHHCRYPDPNG